jgi:hypothetical protein
MSLHIFFEISRQIRPIIFVESINLYRKRLTERENIIYLSYWPEADSIPKICTVDTIPATAHNLYSLLF